ncbi:MAG: hypothetical protein QGG25_16855 [Phycisphaerae bacterium]|nr:hypothetical protein [Phycisphaerae bacterium]
MRKTWTLMTAVIICAGLHAGCGGSQDDAAPPTSSGPEGVVLTMLRALADGNGVAMAACYDCSIEDKEYLIKTMPLQMTIHKLIDAGSKAYGKNVWLETTLKARVGMVKADLETAEDNIQSEITGDIAKCILRGLPRELILRKKGEKWLIVPRPSQIPSLSLRGGRLASMAETKEAIDAIIPKVSAGKIPVDDMCNEIRNILNR